MRSLVIFYILIAGIFLCSETRGQTKASAIPERPGVILIRINPLLDSAIGAEFYTTRPADDPKFDHSDISGSILTGDSSIRALLGLPNVLHGLQLRPFIPTHSVAFEDIRERSNPQLFQHGDVIQSVNHSEGDVLLRTSEDNISHWFILSYSDSISGDRAALLARRSSVILKAEPKFVRQTFNTPVFTPNDSDISQQYALSLMHCFDAWGVVRCDTTMIVADADVGTDWAHPDLDSSIYKNYGEIGIDAHGLRKESNGIDDDSDGFIDDYHGWDFGGTFGDGRPDNDPKPGNGVGHGTHTAGIMGATGNNTIGIAGIAFGARIIPIKISDDAVSELDYGFEGITYAADMHAKLVNCSWGGSGRSAVEQDAINYAYAKDCAVVAAAGNYGDQVAYQDIYPAAYDHVLSIAMVDANGNTVSGSNYNAHVDASAPGWNVLSTVPGDQYITMSGTSMASPNASGVLALVRQRFPNLTAGQAMEQVRVTCNPIGGVWNDENDMLNTNDSERFDFEGHGAIDAFRAVTDTNTFSARVDSFTIEDKNGTGSFAPGESGSIVIHAMNYLKPLDQLQARLQVVWGAQYVTLPQMIVSFGSVGTMQQISNDPRSFQLSIADSVPPGTEILIRVFFYDVSTGYREDYDYISFTVRPAYLDLNANNLTVTFSSAGSLGFNDVLNNGEGSGFLWREPPPAIASLWRQLINEGGLMVGTDSNHVVDVVESADGSTPDLDLTPIQFTHYIVPPDRGNAAQELTFSLTDNLADSLLRTGVRASCRAYAFTQGLAANAVVAKYMFRGAAGSAIAMSDSCAAALFLDWNVGPSGAVNYTRFDPASGTALAYRLEPNYPYIGMKLLSAIPKGAALNYHAIMNDGSQGDINAYVNYTKPAKWTSMTELYDSAGPGDISHTFGLKNMPIHSQDSVEMTVVIALAESPALLQQTIDATAALWAQGEGVTPRSELQSPTLDVFPNPFHNSLHIAWDVTGMARITIYDALGRTVVSKSVVGSEYDFAPPDIPSGVYTVDVAVGGLHVRRQVVASK